MTLCLHVPSLILSPALMGISILQTVEKTDSEDRFRDGDVNDCLYFVGLWYLFCSTSSIWFVGLFCVWCRELVWSLSLLGIHSITKLLLLPALSSPETVSLKLPRLTLNLPSSCFILLRSWDCRPVQRPLLVIA